MLKGFREFIARGNAVDLAVGFVMGVAFTALVTQFTASFLEPLVRVFSGGSELSAGEFTIRGQQFDWAAFVNALVTFLLTATALYFFVVYPMNKLAERRRRGAEPPPEEIDEQVRLLREIRDALVESRPAGPHPTDPQVPGQARGISRYPGT